jgi:hypothetical protein
MLHSCKPSFILPLALLKRFLFVPDHLGIFSHSGSFMKNLVEVFREGRQAKDWQPTRSMVQSLLPLQWREGSKSTKG